MEGSPLPQSMGATSPPPNYGCNAPSGQKAAGKCKTKTRHTLKKPSKLAEKQASRRHQALEKEFSRAQRQAKLDLDQMATTEMELPLGPSTSAQGVWSIPGTPPRLDSPRSPAQQTVTVMGTTKESTLSPLTTAARGHDIGDIFSDGRLEALLSKVVDRALSQRSAQHDQGTPSLELPTEIQVVQEPASPAHSSISGYSSPQEEEPLEMALSEDEELPPEPSSSGGLFNPNLFLTILRKATSTAEIGAEQFPQPQTTPGTSSRPIFFAKVATEHHVPCPDIFPQGIKKQWASPSTLPSVSSTDKRMYNTSTDLSEALEIPKVDEAWTPLVSQTAVVGDLMEVLKADDKRWEQTFRKTHQSAAWAIKTATSASFFVRTILLWLQQLQARVPTEDLRTHQDLAKMVATTEYAADATLQSAIFSSRSIASNIIARRMLWLKNWQADTKIKWRLATAPYLGSNLFGDALAPYLVENRDKRKVMAHLNKKSDRRPAPYFRRQPFRHTTTTPLNHRRKTSPLFPSVGTILHGQLGIAYHPVRVVPGVYSHTSRQTHVMLTFQGPHKTQTYAGGHPTPVGYSGHRTGSTRIQGQGILLHPLRSPQDLRRMEGNPGPQKSQPIHNIQKIQDAIPSVHSGRHQTGRLPGVDRPHGSLPPHPHSHISPSVPTLLLRRQSLPVQGPPFRSLLSTQGVHKNTGGSSRQTQKNPNTCPMLSGRHLDPSNIPPGGSGGYKDRHSHPSTTWVLSKLPKEPDSSLDQTTTSGSHHRHIQLHGLSLPGASGQHQGTGSQGMQATHSSPGNTLPITRQDGLLHSHSPLGQTSFAGPTVVPTPIPTSEHQRLQSPSQGSGAHSQGAPLVVLSGGDQGVTFQGTRQGYHHDRCQSVRLGSPSMFSLRAGTVVRRGTEKQHQLARAQGDPPSPTSLQTQNQGPPCPSPYGQRGSQGTHQPSGGHQVQSPHDGGTAPVRLGRTQPGIAKGGTHIGGQQPTSGLSEPCHSGSFGVGDTPGPILRHLPQVRSANPRPVRIVGQCSTPQILFPVFHSRGGGDGRIKSPVATGTTIRLSPTSAHTGSHPQADSRAGGGDFRGTTLASETMVRRPDEPVPINPVEDSPSPSVSTPRNHLSSGASMVAVGRLALERCIMAQELFSSRAITMIQAARRPSTNRIYDSTWKNFCLWCKKGQIDISSLTIPQIVDYLLDGLDRGLAPATIRRQVAALSTLLTCEDSVPLAHHPRVRAFIKGACNTRPPVVHRYPSWELPQVLRALIRSPFEPLMTVSLRHLSLKVAFLIAITSARRISELAALSVRNDLCIFHSDRVVLRLDPSFIPKVNSLFHRTQEVILPNFCPKPTHDLERQWHTLDVRRALRRYIKRTEPFRKSEALFVSFRPGTLGRKVSAGTIGRWIRSCIAEAYQVSSLPPPSRLTAHSTRSAATSAAWATQASIEEICRAATWSSPSPFIRHYKIDRFASADASFGRRVLQQVVSEDTPSALTVSHPTGQ